MTPDKPIEQHEEKCLEFDISQDDQKSNENNKDDD